MQYLHPEVSCAMAYSRRNSVEEKQEACQKAAEITAKCAQFQITLEPIDWQQFGMSAPVKVGAVEIAPLLELGQCEENDLLRQVQMKLFEHAALATLHMSPDRKASIWSPLEIVQPQPFLSLWIITLETDERIPIAESIKNGQRVYEHYPFDGTNRQQLAKLFGPLNEGEYYPGTTVTIKERDRQYTGTIIYIIPPRKTPAGRTHAPRRYHTASGAAYTNDMAARYVIDCQDGFPHIAHQSQIVQ